MSKAWLGIAAMGACFLGVQALAVEAPYDLIIANGHVIDGTGSPWYAGDVGIRDGRIAAIGKLGNAPATQRIDAAGKVVAPGFIDMLGQSEFTILVDPRLPSKIYQGITTEITGEGTSAAPLIGAARVEATPIEKRIPVRTNHVIGGRISAGAGLRGQNIRRFHLIGSAEGPGFHPPGPEGSGRNRRRNRARPAPASA